MEKIQMASVQFQFISFKCKDYCEAVPYSTEWLFYRLQQEHKKRENNDNQSIFQWKEIICAILFHIGMDTSTGNCF